MNKLSEQNSSENTTTYNTHAVSKRWPGGAEGKLIFVIKTAKVCIKIPQ